MSLFSYTARTLEAMLWKCWRVRKHHWLRTMVEVMAPVLLVILLVSVNAVMEPMDLVDDTSKPTYFIPYDKKFLVRQLCRFGCGSDEQVKILAYAPYNASNLLLTDTLMDKVEANLVENGMDVDARGFDSEAELEAYHAMLGVNKGYDDTMPIPKRTVIIAAVIFVKSPPSVHLSSDLVYKIRLIGNKFITGKLFTDMEYPGPGKHYQLYETQGFLGLQMAVETAFIESMTGNNLTYRIDTQAFPYPPYKHQDKTHYTMVLSRILPAAIVIGFCYMVTNTITDIVKEKETGVRVFLRMTVGLSKPGYWLSWAINFLLPASIAMAIITVLLTVNLGGDGAVLMHSSPLLVLLFLLFYLLASVWFVLFISTLFESSSTANALGIITWIGSLVVPALLIGNKQKFLGGQLMVSVLPNMCLYWGFHTIANWEANVRGLRWKNIAAYPNSTETMNMALIFAELAFTTFFYVILTIFLRHDWSSQKRLKNPCTLIYDGFYDDTKLPECVECFRCGCRCCGCCCKTHPEGNTTTGMDVFEHSAMGHLRTEVLEASRMQGIQIFNSIRFDPNVFQREDVDKVAGIKIRNISKSYKGETTLKFLSCDFYEDEVTILVGPSGAGKTTLVNVITGIDDSDDGIVYVNHYDTRDYPREVRRSIGFCPQNDMLFEELTVMEHLALFAWLKFGDWEDAKNESMRLVQQLHLRDQAKTRSVDLSSSQKRKLSLAIAVAGTPKVIILDEATRGLDAESRKAVWTTLMKIRNERTILITTRSMDEADVLADRVAIINEGCLKSFGTPQFLSTAYGGEYTIKFRVESSQCEKLLRIILSAFPQAQVNNREVTVGGEEISFIVPDSYTAIFPLLFTQLHDRKEALGILSLDVHRTSMEEVFLGVKEFPEFHKHELRRAEDMDEYDSPEEKEMKHRIPVDMKVKLAGHFCILRFKFLLQKQFWIARRNMTIVLCQILLPLMLVLSGITSANRGFRAHDVERRSGIKISLDDYQRPMALHNIRKPDLERAYERVIGRSAVSTRSQEVLRAITKIGMQDEREYRRKYIVGAEFDKENDTITAFYNTIPYHSPPLSLNLLFNALLQYLIPSKKLKILLENHPLSNTTEEILETLSPDGKAAVVKSFCFYFAYSISLVCAFTAIRPLREKTCGAIHQQLITGTHPLNLWISFLVIDSFYALLLSALALLVVWMSEEGSLYTMNEGAIILFLILFVGSIAGTTFSYFMVHWIKRHGIGFGWFNMFHIFAVFLSYVIYEAHPGLDDTLSIVYYSLSVLFPVAFVVHPLSNFAMICIYNSRCVMVSTKTKTAICGKTGAYMFLPSYGCCPNCHKFNGSCFEPWSYFHHSPDGSTTICVDLVILACVSVFYLALTLFIDGGHAQKLERFCMAANSDAFDFRDSTNKNTAEEAEKVRKIAGMGDNAPSSAALLVDGICKNYGNTAAVANVSFATRFGECFGILGLHGAGKTAVFQILTGAQIPAVGDCYLLPYSLLQERMDYLTRISYCPQRDGLLEDLTARQVLSLYGALRGTSPYWLKQESQYWLAALGLELDADRKSRDYSSGMKQRLRIAQALVGDPRVIILDEPTTGVDAAGKRLLWTTLQRLQRVGKAVIIASHDVQECEVLCTRIGLMINGRMQYVDKTAEVKKMFLHGYSVVLRFKLPRKDQESGVLDGGIGPALDSQHEIESILGECILREANEKMLRYLIPQRDQNWGEVFQRLEDIRTRFEDVFQSYAVSSSSLEEVFAAIAEMEMDSTNMLTRSQVNCLQSCLMGQCLNDDYA